jgi:hypothetical protein
LAAPIAAVLVLLSIAPSVAATQIISGIIPAGKAYPLNAGSLTIITEIQGRGTCPAPAMGSGGGYDPITPAYLNVGGTFDPSTRTVSGGANFPLLEGVHDMRLGPAGPHTPLYYIVAFYAGCDVFMSATETDL